MSRINIAGSDSLTGSAECWLLLEWVRTALCNHRSCFSLSQADSEPRQGALHVVHEIGSTRFLECRYFVSTASALEEIISVLQL